MSCKHPTCPSEGPCRRPKKPGINKVSVKRKAQNSLYRKMRKAYLKANPFCAAKLTNCTFIATTIHHPKGRIGNLLTDEKDFIGFCFNCHFTVETEPLFAKEQGFSKSRLSDYDCHSSYPGSDTY